MLSRSLCVAATLIAFLPSSWAQGRLGVVVMHGKQSAPKQHGPLADAIASAGFPVERPEMCWSERRIYDRNYLDCLRDIDTAIARLAIRGAQGSVVVGHSFGANGALGYAARHEVRGVVAIAPGHRPEILAQRAPIAESLERARNLITAGRSNIQATFADINGDVVFAVITTPAIYVSLFGPASPAVMPVNAARLTAPLLYVVGDADPLQRGPEEIFAKAPPHPLNSYVAVPAGHFATSAAAAETVTAWLAQLSRR